LKREKSCGAVVYRFEGERLKILMLRHRRGGHWSFPKGHVEEGETEEETALREIKEETGLDVVLHEGFKNIIEYYPKPGVRKKVIYFLAYSKETNFVRQEEEISELKWLNWDEAFKWSHQKRPKAS
jgi:8-oxo-dGTP pyrophosphatase MutT (NUDIX family)